MSRKRNGRNSRNSLQYTIMIVIIGIALAALINHIGWNTISDFLGLSNSPAVSRAGAGTVQVHFIDVGQGDCALILTAEKAVLIDSGDSQYADTVIQYIRKMEVETIDYIIVSHPHADHIGGMDRIIAAVNVKRLLMPRLPDEFVPTTNTFERMLDAIEEHGVQPAYASTDRVIDLGGATLEILAPASDSEFSGVNDYSIVARLIHGYNSFLFTGDMEKAAEDALLERGADISALVLKVAHHGSRTSSSRGFLEAVKALREGGPYAVINVGSPNRYNHPNDDVLRRLKEMGFWILRTDQAGTIVFESTADGLLHIIHDRPIPCDESELLENAA
jgi:competence protein ComEC